MDFKNIIKVKDFKEIDQNKYVVKFNEFASRGSTRITQKMCLGDKVQISSRDENHADKIGYIAPKFDKNDSNKIGVKLEETGKTVLIELNNIYKI